jgi:hypothetical protein
MVLWHINLLLSCNSVNNVSATCSHANKYACNNRVTVGNGVSLCGPCWDVRIKGQYQLIGSSAWEAVKIEPERMKLKSSVQEIEPTYQSLSWKIWFSLLQPNLKLACSKILDTQIFQLLWNISLQLKWRHLNTKYNSLCFWKIEYEGFNIM